MFDALPCSNAAFEMKTNWLPYRRVTCMDLEWCIGPDGRLCCQLVGLKDRVDGRTRRLSHQQ